jgi:hypothetical protein
MELQKNPLGSVSMSIKETTSFKQPEKCETNTLGQV